MAENSHHLPHMRKAAAALKAAKALTLETPTPDPEPVSPSKGLLSTRSSRSAENSHSIGFDYALKSLASRGASGHEKGKAHVRGASSPASIGSVAASCTVRHAELLPPGTEAALAPVQTPVLSRRLPSGFLPEVIRQQEELTATLRVHMRRAAVVEALERIGAGHVELDLDAAEHGGMSAVIVDAAERVFLSEAKGPSPTHTSDDVSPATLDELTHAIASAIVEYEHSKAMAAPPPPPQAVRASGKSTKPLALPLSLEVEDGGGDTHQLHAHDLLQELTDSVEAMQQVALGSPAQPPCVAPAPTPPPVSSPAKPPATAVSAGAGAALPNAFDSQRAVAEAARSIVSPGSLPAEARMGRLPGK